ncbi:MAG: hypothetical protein HC813_03790, partial [Planctomycetes bacterium]|nr:hypothetical protein [Planctomycetota bacterium]
MSSHPNPGPRAVVYFGGNAEDVTQTLPALRAKIASPEKHTVSGELFAVCRDHAPILLGVVPDRGFIDGGDQVVLFGANFLKADGASNVKDVRFVDPVLGDLGDYTEASPASLPLDSSKAANKGKYVVLNDHEILVITHARAPIAPESAGAPANVIVESLEGSTQLLGGYTYINTPAVRTPMLYGITPNETRLNGGTSHLLSGRYLTEADRIVLSLDGDPDTVTIAVPGPGTREVNDSFIVFVMPDLGGAFKAGDVLNVHAEKDLSGGTLVSNKLLLALRVTFAGPPIITPDLSPKVGPSFGGTEVTITGALFTTNSQVLFGTMPARHVVRVGPTTLIAIAPTLPVDVPSPGIDLKNIHTADGSVDVAVFTQGGWAVLEDGYTFEPAKPTVDSCFPESVAEGALVRVTLRGTNFVPDLTDVTSLLGGLISNKRVEDFGTFSFDYKAPTFPAMTDGPKVDTLTLSTNQGTAAAPCPLSIDLKPYATDCATSYSLNDHAAPTSGVESGKFVVVTIEGGNLQGGRNAGAHPTARVEQAEADRDRRGGTLHPGRPVPGRHGQEDRVQRALPPPLRRSEPRRRQPERGARGCGLHRAERPRGHAGRVLRLCAVHPRLRRLRLQCARGLSAPLLPRKGDGRRYQRGRCPRCGDPRPADGRRRDRRRNEPPGDLRLSRRHLRCQRGCQRGREDSRLRGHLHHRTLGDNSVKTFVPSYARGQNIRLANMDADAELEIVLAAALPGDLSHRVRVVVVDTLPGGGAGPLKILDPTLAHSDAITGLDVGRFDATTSALDIVAIVTHNDLDKRKLVIFKSTGTLTWSPVVIDIPAAFEHYGPGTLSAGDFDGDGDEDLIWGQYYTQVGGAWETFEILYAEVDAAAGTVGTIKAISNFTGGSVTDIDIVDVDGDKKVDALVNIRVLGKGTLGGVAINEGGGVLTVLDLIDTGTADFYTPSEYRITPLSREGNGIGIGHGDLNGDGIVDVAMVNDIGEILVMLGDGKGAFSRATRSWQQVTTTTTFLYPVQAIDVGDINGDGLAEIWLGGHVR